MLLTRVTELEKKLEAQKTLNATHATSIASLKTELITKLDNSNSNLLTKFNSSVFPAGTVVAFAGETGKIPTGWLLCDGRTFAKAQYPALSDALSTVTDATSSYAFNADSSIFKIPDYRGLFLRGGNQNRADAFADSERKSSWAGSLQMDQFKSHTHVQHYMGKRSTFMAGGGTGWDQDGTATTQPAGGTETRPKNITVYYIIKT